MSIIFNKIRFLLRRYLPQDTTQVIRRWMETGLHKSIQQAIREQKLQKLYEELTIIVPDISHQYSAFQLDSEYLVMKVRGVHAFQIRLVQNAIAILEPKKEVGKLTVLDIGDSAGTHLRYLKNIYPGLQGISVNLEQEAIARIEACGGTALHMRAEKVSELDIHPDILLSFEMLEHLSDPISFLHNISSTNIGEFFVVTVPFIRKSRIALDHIRNGQTGKQVGAETTHVFELNPSDWKLIFQHTGWKIVQEETYWQYPSRSPRFITKYLWQTIDVEGFWGVILRKDHRWSSIYKDW